MSPEVDAAVNMGLALVERAAKYACDMGTLYGLHTAAVCGHLWMVQDPERFVDDVMRATWEVMRPNGHSAVVAPLQGS